MSKASAIHPKFTLQQLALESFQQAGILIASSDAERNAVLASTRSFTLPRGCEDEGATERDPSCSAVDVTCLRESSQTHLALKTHCCDTRHVTSSQKK
mmetsp:Transcript_18381/g.28655  ORF Transcript_18381/g.28655 Transcript_18381/m.28655 type:complete len:98 (+) Transcript_18381:458-751(+)